ncbi:hypothetical protein AB0N62_41810 [Streptomyces sp. NPDC093982]|uniref:hypothetical protein n=1 Tax=Streptomyces sp. NPDC093982 TaxID=3155077 RepID=UPI003445D6F5
MPGHLRGLVWEPVVRHRSLLVDADGDEVPPTEIRGEKAHEVRATYELLAHISRVSGAGRP